jgi:hypothetical protein
MNICRKLQGDERDEHVSHQMRRDTSSPGLDIGHVVQAMWLPTTVTVSNGRQSLLQEIQQSCFKVRSSRLTDGITSSSSLWIWNMFIRSTNQTD